MISYLYVNVNLNCYDSVTTQAEKVAFGTSANTCKSNIFPLFSLL